MKKEFKPIVGNDVKPTARAAIFRLPSVNEVRPPSSVNDAKKMMELGSKLMRAGMNQTRMNPESRHILSLAMSSLSATDLRTESNHAFISCWKFKKLIFSHP